MKTDSSPQLSRGQEFGLAWHGVLSVSLLLPPSLFFSAMGTEAVVMIGF